MKTERVDEIRLLIAEFENVQLLTSNYYALVINLVIKSQKVGNNSLDTNSTWGS